MLSVPLREVSAKIRSGDPVDEDIDLDGPHWAGVVPLTTRWGTPAGAADLRGTPSVPSAVESLAGEIAQSTPPTARW